MSVELYPTIESLDEKLSSLEDPILAARILSANPQLFPSAAAEEELSVFAAAWKRFGKIALAATAVASLIAGYVVIPKFMQHPAAVPAPIVHKAPAHASTVVPARMPAHVIAKMPAAHKVVVPIAAVTHAAISAPVPTHRAAPAPQPAVAHHVAVSQAAAAAPATQAAAAAAPAEKPLAYETNAQIVSGNQPAADMPMPNGTKTAYTGTGPNHVPAPLVVDSCTPSGGRIGSVLMRLQR